MTASEKVCHPHLACEFGSLCLTVNLKVGPEFCYDIYERRIILTLH